MSRCSNLIERFENLVQITKDLPMIDKSKATKKGIQPIVYINGSDGYFYGNDGILRQIRTLKEIKKYGYKKFLDPLADVEKMFVDKKITMSKYYELAAKLENDYIN